MNQKTNEAAGFQIQVGHTYELQDGTTVLILGRTGYKGYETVYDEHGYHRYDRSTHSTDAGRCTGTAHDYSYPGNLKRPIVPLDADPVRLEAEDYVAGQKLAVERMERRLAGFERLTLELTKLVGDQRMEIYSLRRWKEGQMAAEEERLIQQRDRAEAAADQLSSIILEEEIDWPDHAQKWEEALEAINTIMDRHIAMRAFVESLTDALGPYPYIDKTGVVADARRVLRGEVLTSPESIRQREDIRKILADLAEPVGKLLDPNNLHDGMDFAGGRIVVGPPAVQSFTGFSFMRNSSIHRRLEAAYAAAKRIIV